MGKLQGRGIFLYDLWRALIIPEKSIPEKRVLYVHGKHCGLITRITRIDAHKKRIFTHVGLSAHAHNNYCARG